MLNDAIKITGTLSVVKTNEYGHVENHFFNNLIVDNGKKFILDKMTNNGSQSIISKMAVGTNPGPVAPAPTQGALISILGTAQNTTTSRPSNTSIQYVASFPAGSSTGAIAEAGLFNTDATPIMLSRTTFPVINKSSTDSIVITWVISIA